VKRGAAQWAVWLIPATAAALVFCPAILNGQSLFLRYAWDPNNILAFYPWNVFSAREFALGQFPLWNPHNACGVPHLANWQSAPLYPLHLLLFLHPTIKTFDIFFLARLFILAAGTWLAARSLGMGMYSSVCALVAATFSGYFMAYGSMVHMNAEVLFPWALWLVTRQVKRWKISNWTGLTVVFASVYMGGNGESAFYLVAITLAWAMWLDIFEGKRLFFASIAAAAVALILAAPQLIPFFEYFPRSWHIHPHGAGSYWLDPRGMYSILFAVSGETGGFYIPYFGAGVLLLAILGSTFDRRLLFFPVASLGIFSLVYGMPGFRWVTHLPIFSRTASFKYALAPLAVMVALLAGRGVYGISVGNIDGRRARRVALALAVFAAAFALGTSIGGKNFNFAAAGIGMAILGAAALAVSLLGRRSAVLLSLLVAVELVLNAHALGLKPLLDPLRHIDREEVRYLKGNRPTGRAASAQVMMPSNLNLVAGFDDVNLLDALYPAGYVRKIGLALGFKQEESIEYFKTHGYSFPITYGSVDSLVWAELGVRYYFVFYGEGIARPWMRWVGGLLWEDVTAHSILAVDGRTASWAEDSRAQDLIWRGSSSARLLRARITLLPGWRAWSDGVEMAVSEWNDLFIEVGPPKPAREIRLRYVPWGWKLGMWSGIASVFSLTSLMILFILKYRGIENEEKYS